MGDKGMESEQEYGTSKCYSRLRALGPDASLSEN